MLRPCLEVVHWAASGQLLQVAAKWAICPSPAGLSWATRPAGQVTVPASWSIWNLSWECHKVCVRQERMEPHAFNTREEVLISASLS